MNKYIKNMSQWGIFFLLLASCTPEDQVVFHSCAALEKKSPCVLLSKNLSRNLLEERASFNLLSKSNSLSEFQNLIRLNLKLGDAAMLFYDAFKYFYPQKMKGLLASEKFIPIPLLIVAKNNFSFQTLPKNTEKPLKIGIPNDLIEQKIILSLLSDWNVSYQIQKNLPVNFLSLMDDGDINLFICASIMCQEVLPKISQIVGGIRLLTPPSLPKKASYLSFMDYPISSLRSLGFSNKKTMRTLSLKEYLVMRKDIPSQKQNILLRAFNHDNIGI